MAENDTPSIENLLDTPIKEAVRELEIRLLKKVLTETKYNQMKAAQVLGLTYHKFRGL